MVRSIVATPGQPVTGSNQRKIVAFARKAPEVPSEKLAYVPMPEVATEPRQAKVQAANVDAHA